MLKQPFFSEILFLLANFIQLFNLKKSEIDELERTDRQMILKWLKTPFSIPQEAVYLELGIQPLGRIIIERRMNYLHYLCNRPKQSMLYKFFKVQWMNPNSWDWTFQVKNDMKDLGLNLSH